MGGIVWSKPSRRHLYIDGLEFSSNIERDFEPTEASDKLEQLLRATATSYRPSVIGPALVSAFYLGAFAEQLTLLYEKWVDEIGTPWPEENPVAESIGKDDITEHFSDKEYELRYYDYFRDCLTESRNWNKVVQEHIDAVWVRLFRDDFRPLITLASAVEMSNGFLACQALTMACADEVGTVAEIKSNDIPPTNLFNGEALAVRFRELANCALKSKALEPVVAVHSCAEIFLRMKGGNLIGFERSMALLDHLDKYLRLNCNDLPKIEKVDNSDALFTDDWRVIMYTRSRMVLEKFAF